MPIYEYRCNKCGKTFEVMHGFNDPGPTKCERCGAHGKGVLTRLISPAQVVFKGSGFYLTDHREAKNATLEGPHGDGRDKREKKEKTDKPAPEPAAATKDTKKED